MTTEQKIEIALKLQEQHYFFRAFWDICNIEYTKKDSDIDTAAVMFDNKGSCISLEINKTFWDSLNETSKTFLICHECLHVVLNHAKRFLEYYNTPHFLRMNIAADVVINEMLIKQFGFKREELNSKISKDGCWIDTVKFIDKKNILDNESTEYYFNRLLNNDIKNIKTLDKHIIMSEEDIKNVQDYIETSGLIDKIDKDLHDKLSKSTEYRNTLNDKSASVAGVGTGSWSTVNAKFSKKKKWETVIKKWESSHLNYDLFFMERWDRVSPRYSEIINDKTMLPTENWIINESMKEDRISVFFFLDVSGSCYHLKDRFFKAARSLDPKRFDIRLFSFDTSVEELNIKEGKVYGGGGTSFSVIENKIQSICKKEGKPYPKSVWIVTDGEGTDVRPEKPERWNWFLTGSAYKWYIPKKSKVYMLKDYE